MSRTFTLAVERVADDRRFAERFRRDPHRALRRYRLSDDQVDAIKAGDFVPLARHGLDVQQFQAGKRHGWRPYWRKAVVGVTVLGATLGLMGAPASATEVIECGKIRCTGPRLAGLRVRRANMLGLDTGRDQIRIGRFLIERASLRTTLRRAGARMDAGRALGRRALIGRLSDLCGDEGCLTEVNGEPILLAAP